MNPGKSIFLAFSIRWPLSLSFLSIPFSRDHAIEWIMEVVWLMTWKSMDNMVLAWGANIRSETCSLDSPWSNEKRLLEGFFWLVSFLVLLLIRSISLNAEDFSFIQLKLHTNMFPCYWTGCKFFFLYLFFVWAGMFRSCMLMSTRMSCSIDLL